MIPKKVLGSIGNHGRNPSDISPMFSRSRPAKWMQLMPMWHVAWWCEKGRDVLSVIQWLEWPLVNFKKRTRRWKDPPFLIGKEW